jgi:hypothetical protein
MSRVDMAVDAGVDAVLRQNWLQPPYLLVRPTLLEDSR